ncbi:MAG TPA: FAD-linked oxidase, partial [Candidatus Dormibacteraeota bacterium]|nr:FAD-linked oxidase [Candidatus Dormibacteraeota bacterium]
MNQAVVTAADGAAVEALAAQVRGGVIRPADTGYDDARAVWNWSIDRRPAVIVRCAGPADVIAALA